MIVSIAAAFLCAAIADSAPCPPPKKSEAIRVMVLVILASDKNDTVEMSIKEIAAEVGKKDAKLTGFTLKKTFDKSIKMGESQTIELTDKAKMVVTVNEKTDDEGRVTITVKPPKLEELTYTCTCGKFFPIITNCWTADKQRVIIAIMAKPCKKNR